MKTRGNKALLVGGIISFVFAALTLVAAIFFLTLFGAIYNDLSNKEVQDPAEAFALAFLIIFVAIYQIFGAFALIVSILLIITGIFSMISYKKPKKGLLIAAIAMSVTTTMIPTFVGAIVTLSQNKEPTVKQIEQK